MAVDSAGIAELTKRFKKDLTNWNRDECLIALQTFSSIRRQTFAKQKCLFKKYVTETYGETGDEIAAIIEGIDYSDLKIEAGISKEYFYSFAHLISKINEQTMHLSGYFDPYDSYLIATVYLYFAYVGMDEEEARSITQSDVSEGGRRVTTSKGVYTFPKAAAGNIERLARMKEMVFLWKSSNENTVGTSSKYTLCESDYLFRGIKTGLLSRNYIRTMISDLNKGSEYTGVKFLLMKVSESGRFERLFQYEQEHGAVYKITKGGQVSLSDQELCANLVYKVSPDEFVRMALVDTYKRYHAYKKCMLSYIERGLV